MNTRSLAFVLALVVVPATMLAAAAPALAGETAAAKVVVREDAVAAYRGLGAAPALDAVLRVARAAEFGDAMEANRFAGVLVEQGGYVAARALGVLVWHRDSCVRATALRAIAQLKIRLPASDMDPLRSAVKDADPAVRQAAVAALGAIGEDKDVPALLDAMDSPDPAFVASAFGALRELSGARLRCRVAVWRHWWIETQTGGPARLAAALTAVEKGGAAEVTDALRVIERSAWVRLGEVRDRLTSWFSSDKPELRREAYRLMATLRLGDLAERLTSALGWDLDEDCRGVGAESARALGIELPNRSSLPVR